MTVTRARPMRAFVHQAAIFGSDEEFLGTVVPFVREGVAAGEPTMIGVCRHESDLLRDALGDTTGVDFLPSTYANPLLTLRHNRDLLTQRVAAGPARLVGQIPPRQLATNWPGWMRYEAAVEHVLAALPVRSLCSYDARSTSPAVLADVQRTHPRLATAGGPPRDNVIGDTAPVLADCLRGTPDPIEQAPPDVTLADPRVRDARQAVIALAHRTGLGPDEVDGLALAVGEVVANARQHGRPAVTMQAWAAPDRVVVTVTDSGSGPGSPLAWLAPETEGAGPPGFGLWIAHQMCTRVDHIRHADGFTVRLTTTTTTPAG